MATRETGKQRRSRIPLDYYKHSEPLRGWKVRLGVLAVVLAAGYWASGLVSGGAVGRMRYSRGPVAEVHAMWDSNCSVCHQRWTPIDSQSWLTKYFGEEKAGDRQCQSCHKGPQHAKNEIATETPSCASCHREHRGREASLVKMPDNSCTQCHEDLKNHATGGSVRTDMPVDALRVTEFAEKSHPEFEAAASKKDPGKLRFSHARHLAPGMPQVEKDGSFKADSGVWTYAHFKDEDRLRYWQQKHPNDTSVPDDQLNQSVELNCASCHRLESDDFGVAADRRRSAGLHATPNSRSYMLPISYENQCRACHPLTFEEGEQSTEAVPHGLQPPDVQRVLKGVFIGRMLAGKELPAEAPAPSRRLPGRATTDDSQSANARVNEQIAVAEKVLYSSAQTCGRCHYFQQKPDDTTPSAIVPTAVPDRWMNHGRFDHAAHRATDCLTCHANAPTSTTEAAVLVPGQKICQQCHAPSPAGGARFDCVECHRYHNGDQPHQGIGAQSRGAARVAKDASKFISGPGQQSGTQSATKP